MNTNVITKVGTVHNDIKRESFEIIKISSNTNDTATLLENVEFTAILKRYVEFYGSYTEALKHTSEYADDEWSIIKTNSAGYGISKLLSYGTYVVNETYNEHEGVNIVKEFEVTLTEDSKTPTQIWKVENDTPFTAYLKLVKKDKETGKTVIYSNATFKLQRLNGLINKWENVKCKIGKDYYDTWTTDSAGIAYTETKLNYGTYKLSEISIPEGFLQLEKDIIFKVTASNSTCEYDEDYDAWITVEIENERPKGKLEIYKEFEQLTESENTTYFAENIDYSKIQYRLTAAENIIDYSDGSYIYKVGDIIGTYSLNSDSTLTVDNLPMGKYLLKEISTLDGYVLDKTVHEVNFEKKDDTTKVYTIKLKLENLMTTVELKKMAIADNKTDVNKFVEGSILSLYEVIDNNGTEELKLIDEWKTNDNSHIVKGLKIGTKCKIIETSTAEGYVTASPIEFIIKDTTDTQEIIIVDKQVTVSKKNVGGIEIEGATLQVIDKETKEIIDEWISTKEPHIVVGLIENKTYILHELVQAENYVLATDIEFTVSGEKVNEHYDLVDKQVTVSKVDIGGTEIEGATLQVIDKETQEIVEEWISTKEPHIVKGLVENKTYILHEEVSAENYVVATDIEFTISEEKVNEHYEMIDKQVSVNKTDKEGKQLEGAVLQIIDKNGNVVDEWETTKEAHITSNLIEGEQYILREIKTPEPYVTAADILFTVTKDKETQEITMIDKLLMISKKDITTGEELPEAELTVTDKDGNIIDKWISGNEPHYIAGVKENEEYILTEITCPYGYEQAESITFTVTEDKETQLVEMLDSPILTNIKLIKVDSETKESIKSDFVFGLYADEACTKLIMEFNSDKNEGTILFESLRYNTFYIKELLAPKRISSFK